MTPGLPWSVKGIEPEMRADALHAAHASGMTLGQWLNGVIRDSVVDLKAARGEAQSPRSSEPHPATRQEMAGSPMTHFQAQQQYPYGAGPYVAPAPVAPPFAMPAPAPVYPYAPPQAYMPYPPMPVPHAADLIEQRLRAYASGETAVGSVPGADKLLKVIDAAVRSSEQKTAAAIEALATLMEKQRKADAESQARQAALQAAHAQQAAMAAQVEQMRQRSTSEAQAVQSQAMREIEAARADLQTAQARDTMAQNGAVAEVTQVLSKMAERLEGLEKSFAAVRQARSEEQMVLARESEERIGQALESMSRDVPAPEHEAYDDAAEHEMDAPARQAVRPPPRTHGRPRITVPRTSPAVQEIAARQRALEAAPGLEPRTTPEAAALDAIRRSIAALADQVRDTSRGRDSARGTDGSLRDELKDLQRSVQELAPRRIVASVNESIRALAQRIEQSRQEGVRESHLAPIETLLNEMRSNLMELREPRGLTAVNETLSQLGDKVESLSARHANDPQLDGIREEISALRAYVAEARQNQPLETIRGQLSALTDKLDALSERPRDTRVISLLTDAVEDVRHSLRKLDPEAVFTRLERRLDGLEGLGQRIDVLAHRLEAHTPAVGFDASGLAERIDALAERLDRHVPGTGVSPDLSGLTDRIDQMTRALQTRPDEPDLTPLIRRMDIIQETIENTGPDARSLEGTLRRLAERMDDVRSSNASSTSLDALQSQIVQLAEKLDRAPQGVPNLGGVERTLSDLVAKVASFPDTAAEAAQSAAQTAARSLARDTGPGSMDALAAEGMMLIKRDLTEMRSAQADADAKSRALMQQVNSTLETIAGRLAKLEGEQPRPRPQAQMMPAPPPQPAPRASQAGAVAPRMDLDLNVDVADRPMRIQTSQAGSPPIVPRPAPTLARGADADRPLTTAGRRPALDADADMPLEPGANGAPAEGIGHNDPKQAFIQAARRAAQVAATQSAAAVAEMEERATRVAHKSAGRSTLEGLKAGIANRRTPILLSIAALALVVGGMKVGWDAMNGEPQPAEVARTASRQPVEKQPAAAPETEKVAIAPQAAPAEQPARTVAAAPGQFAAPSAQPPARAPEQVTSMDLMPKASEADGSKALDGLANGTQGLGDKIKQSALAGNLSAAYEIGARLAEGRNGLPRDAKLASQWLESAADRGFAPAQYRLGSFFREGIGVNKDAKVAMTWFKKAADQGNVSAMHNLGVLFSEGVPNSQPDYASAAQWFSTAAEYGVKDSQFNIAILYTRGLGVKQDLVEAYKWFSVAARQGDQEAIKKRDALFSQLPPEKQSVALKAAEAFQQKKADVRSNEIIVPDGGWDGPKLPSLAVPMSKKPAKSV